MRNLLSFNIMKKITLIFLLFANMIASGQISRIRLDMQLIDTINNDVLYKFIGTNNEDILCLSDENGLFDFLVDSTYNENSYIFFHKNPKDTLYLKDLKAFESNNMDGYIVKLLKIETFTKEEFEKYMKDNALIPERQEYPLLNDNQSDDESKIAEKRRFRRIRNTRNLRY